MASGSRWETRGSEIAACYGRGNKKGIGQRHKRDDERNAGATAGVRKSDSNERARARALFMAPSTVNLGR